MDENPLLSSNCFKYSAPVEIYKMVVIVLYKDCLNLQPILICERRHRNEQGYKYFAKDTSTRFSSIILVTRLTSIDAHNRCVGIESYLNANDTLHVVQNIYRYRCVAGKKNGNIGRVSEVVYIIYTSSARVNVQATRHVVSVCSFEQ